ncbi:MAG: DMT family transporter [Anaerolineae bacterium]|nr:DMT family transporter [Thermoflexus sp.]MDW8064642.1 DMT family transporter [Anaerolineae bacterium]
MRNVEKPPLSPYLVLLIGILAVSMSSIFIRFAQREASSLVIAAYRLALATLLILPVAFTRYRHELRQLRGRDLLWMGLSGIFLAFHFVTWITSLEYTTVASSVVLVSLSPAFVAIAAPVFLREAITSRVILGIFIALAGSAVVGFSDACSWPPLRCTLEGDGRLPIVGNLLALIGAIMVAGYFMIGRQVRSRFSLPVYISLVYGSAALVCLLIVAGSGLPILGYPPQTYFWMSLIAIFPQFIGHSSFNWALRYLPAAVVTVTTLGEPIGSTILAYVILREAPPWIKILGGGLILTGIAIVSQEKAGRTKA